MIATLRASLITLSVLTFLAGIVFPPLHLVTLVLMTLTGGLMLLTWLDGKAKVSPRGAKRPSASRDNHSGGEPERRAAVDGATRP